MIRLTIMAGALLMAAMPGVTAAALTPTQRAEVVETLRQALKDDPSILRDALAALQVDDMRRQETASADAIQAQHAELFSDAADQVTGNPAGAVTVVEFYDPRCPYCRQMLPVIAALVQSDPNVRVVFKDIPILGPASVLESRALLAAQRQGGYMRLQSAIMNSSATPTAASLRAEAERQGLDGARFEHDMADPAIEAKLAKNLRLATQLHVDGTPALIVGHRMISGAVELADLQRTIASR